MFVGKVIGKVVSTQKVENLRGIKLLAVQPVNDDLNPEGNPLIVIDTIGQSGEGDLVYIAKSGESSIPLNRDMVASDAGIMGIIEYYNVN